MNDFQFNTVRDILMTIEGNTRKKEGLPLSVPPTNKLFNKLQLIFFAKLEAKTGWGKNEVKRVFEDSLYTLAAKDDNSSAEKGLPF